MRNANNLREDIQKQANLLKSRLSEKDYKKYKVPLLLCLAERVTEFKDVCSQCQLLQQEISTLIQDLGNLVQFESKDRRKSYYKSVKKIVNHFKKEHKLVEKGYYIGIGIAIGSGIGVALGSAFERLGSGIPIGVGIGFAIGTALEAKAKREGRIICPEETAATTLNVKILLIILALVFMVGLAAFLIFRQL